MPKKPIIDYTNADFDSIKSALIEHAQRYYPNRYNDFSDASFGSMLFDMIAYVGDSLSFNLDFNVNESFLETALEYSNVRRLADQMGYRFYGKSAAFGTVDLYVLVPSMENEIGPNEALFPIIKKGSRFMSSDGALYTLTEDVDFTRADIDTVAARYDDRLGRATEYALRASGQVKSGATYLEEVEVEQSVPNLRLYVAPSGINEIISVFDEEGHEWHQVDHLSQEVVYIETTNPNAAADGVRSILKPYIASRRFIVEQDDTGTYLQFGNGSETEFDTTGIVDPSTVMMNMTGKNYITDNAFDPNKLITTEKLGIAPSQTTFYVSYSSNNTIDVNVARGALNSVQSLIMDFPNDPDREYASSYTSVEISTEVSNDAEIVYDSSMPTTEEIKYRAYGIYSTQNRVVTKQDYEAYVYQMPPTFGSIKRASIYNDPSGTNKRLCLYIIGSDTKGDLMSCNDVIKNNIKTWLGKSKMISDVLDIKDAKIINVGFEYEFVVNSRFDKNDFLLRVQSKLEEMFSEKMYIGESLSITEIYNAINKTRGVIDTVKVTPVLKTGVGYANALQGIEDILSKDGTFINTPKNCILEIKNPSLDIKGMIV
jgi:hypothetical protein